MKKAIAEIVEELLQTAKSPAAAVLLLGFAWHDAPCWAILLILSVFVCFGAAEKSQVSRHREVMEKLEFYDYQAGQRSETILQWVASK